MKLDKKYILLLVLCLLAIGHSVYLHFSKPKMGYVNLVKVYQDFELKKEKEKDILQFDNVNKRILDSLKIGLETIKRNYDSGIGNADTLITSYKMGLKYYKDKSDEFDLMKSNLITKYDDEIWKQLNQFITDYSVDRSFDFMFGANGNGTVMYANPVYDVTDDVIKYVNERYSGKE